MIKIKFLKDTELKKKGDIVNCSQKSAETSVSQGYAEYIEEAKGVNLKEEIYKEIIDRASKIERSTYFKIYYNKENKELTWHIFNKFDKFDYSNTFSINTYDFATDFSAHISGKNDFLTDNQFKLSRKIDEYILKYKEKPRDLLKEEGNKHKASKSETAIQKLNEKAGIKPEGSSPFILDAEKLPQRIDHALGLIKIEGKEYRYFGARLNEWITKTINKGKKTEKEVTYPEMVEAIITEDGRIISSRTKPKELRFEFDSIMSLKTNRWSLKSIKEFTEGNINREDYTFEKVFGAFQEHYTNAMVYEDLTWYKFDAIWDMTTYTFDTIYTYMVIKHEGISGTAKSKGMKISANLSFNGKKFLCPTPANFFRYRHNNKATIYIEEAEKLFDQSKKQNQGDSELVEYLNGSYEKGNTVPRQNDKDVNQTDEFDPAGFTRIGAISELKGALRQRSLIKQMVKAPASDKRGNVEVPAETDKDYCNSRDKAYICKLLNYKEYEKALIEVKNKYGLANRQWVLAKPLIATARCVSHDLEKEIGDFIAKGFENRDSSFDEKSWERILANLLIELYCTKEEGCFFSTEEVKSVFASRITGNYKISTIKVGMLMNTLGLSDFRKSNGELRGIKISFNDLISILIRQDYTSKENIQNRCQGCQGCKYSSKMIDDMIDNLLTPYTLNKGEEQNE